jgi:hypothetical protein
VVSRPAWETCSSIARGGLPNCRENEDCFLVPLRHEPAPPRVTCACACKELRMFIQRHSVASRKCFFSIPAAALLPRLGARADGHADSGDGDCSSQTNPIGCVGSDGMYTMQRMFDEGIRGLMLPLKDFGMVQADIPFFIRGKGIRSMHVGTPGEDSRQATPRQKHGCLPKREAMFENMCGSAYLRMYRMPPHGQCSSRSSSLAHCQGSGTQQKQQSPTSCTSFPVCDSCMRRAGSVSSSFSPSSCREIFSIHGNITLRKDPSGIVASFKVMT